MRNIQITCCATPSDVLEVDFITSNEVFFITKNRDGVYGPPVKADRAKVQRLVARLNEWLGKKDAEAEGPEII